MRLRRFLRIAAAFLVLGAISADLASNRCDLPLAVGPQVVLTTISSRSAADDPCDSGCVPDCFSCARSEVVAPNAAVSGTHVIVTVFTGPETHASDGVRPLPYHPPLNLL